LELDLPARDARRQSADNVVAGVLSGLRWRGVDVEGDGVRIVVALVKKGDATVSESAEG